MQWYSSVIRALSEHCNISNAASTQGGIMIKHILSMLALVILTGCATIFTKSTDPITFTSIPEGAKVEVNGANVGRTPITVPIKRALTPPQVQLKLTGYETQQVLLQNSFNGVAILNIFFWPGFIVDAATGALMDYEIKSYETTLEPKEP